MTEATKLRGMLRNLLWIWPSLGDLLIINFPCNIDNYAELKDPLQRFRWAAYIAQGTWKQRAEKTGMAIPTLQNLFCRVLCKPSNFQEISRWLREQCEDWPKLIEQIGDAWPYPMDWVSEEAKSGDLNTLFRKLKIADGIADELSKIFQGERSIREYELKELKARVHFAQRALSGDYPREKGSDSVLGARIEEMCLSVRSYNALKKAGIRTIGELIGLSEYDLMGIRNMGRKCLNEIKDKLADLGFSLPIGTNEPKETEELEYIDSEELIEQEPDCIEIEEEIEGVEEE